VPLIVALHGGGGNGRQFERSSGLNRIADEENVIVVYPDGLDKGWNDSREIDQQTRHDDVGFIRALIEHLSTQYSIDASRVFVTGVSNGAMMSYRLACELSGTIRGIAPVVGNLPVMLNGTCAPSQPVPVRMIVGTNDGLVPYEGGGVGFFGRRGNVLSAHDTAARWAGFNGCTETPTVTQPSGALEVTTYAGCAAPVGLYTVLGGRHTWYAQRRGDTLDAANTVWEFFSSL
jgi:polyhydroxybutyrate depolymerase